MSTLESPHTTDTTHADTADAESTGAAAPLPDGVEHGASVQPTILEVVAWTDPIDDAAGHDPRSDYVERFWLGLLGPAKLAPAVSNMLATSFAVIGSRPSALRSWRA